MARKFGEYKPYATIGQFRRKIGHYADEAEVADLQRYTLINQALVDGMRLFGVAIARIGAKFHGLLPANPLQQVHEFVQARDNVRRAFEHRLHRIIDDARCIVKQLATSRCQGCDCEARIALALHS